jgi:hypothetical protein
VVRYVDLHFDEYNGQALANPVRFTLVMFSLPALVLPGIHLALHAYSSHDQGNGQLVNEIYAFTYDSFAHAPWFHLPISNPDFAKALTELPNMFNMPGLGWGPENFSELARSQNTTALLISLIRCAIAVLFFALSTCGFVSPSTGTAKAAGGRKMSMAVMKPKEEDIAVTNPVGGNAMHSTTRRRPPSRRPWDTKHKGQRVVPP